MNKKIHFIGIGGIGTSSIAQIYAEKGNDISGSDLIPSKMTQSLKSKGIKISIGHNSKNIPKKCNLVIYSPAIPHLNSELKEAKKRGIRTISYPKALGELTEEYFTVAIAGTHGKSTVTAMIAITAVSAGLDPSVVVGTKLKEFKDKNYRVGKSDLLILEACEYKKSFLHLHPDILVITNIEADHLDFYKNLKNYKQAFTDLAKTVHKEGSIIIDPGDQNSVSAIAQSKQNIIYVNKKEKLQPKIPGDFNILNAQTAATVCQKLGISKKIIIKSLNSYEGSWRRMEYKKTKFPKTIFIDDYAHHPTEIETTLNAIKEQYPKSKVLCIFQPHQYSRTRLLLKEFGKSFYMVDKVIIPNIYRVRDTKRDIKNVSTDILVNEISSNSKNAQNGNGLKKTAEYIKAHHKEYDLIITMGAGDVDNIYKYL